MVGKTNVAGARLHAMIAVTYPAGSVCTCINGTKTLKARDTSGKALFNVTVGEWTVKAEDTAAGKSKSANVSITEEGHCESVTLKYSLDIIVNGKFDYDVIGSWTSSDGSSGLGSMVEHESDGYVQLHAPLKDSYNGTYTAWDSTKALPTSEYTTLYVDYSAVLNGYASQFLAIGGVSVGTNSTSSDARNTRAVDISGLTDNYKLTMVARSWAGNGGVSIYIYNMYLA